MGDWHAASSLKAPLVEEYDPHFLFTSRRSPVVCRHACVATSQPLATEIGLTLLRGGANAADVAIAVAAALAVTEPCSTGLGGDMFCLYYKASDKQVYAVNGSGRSPQSLTLDQVKKDCPDLDKDFMFSVHAVTVPGAARGWQDTFDKYGSGKFTFAQLLEPAALLAEEGFPVSPVTAHHWASGRGQLSKWVAIGEDIPFTVEGFSTPKVGQIFANPDMARVLRDLGKYGATQGFYEGATGEAIIEAVQKNGGLLSMNDLKNQTSHFPEPISAEYRNVKLWQIPPNGQGISALIALTGLEALEDSGVIPKMSPDTIGTADFYHAQIEMMRLGFADAREHVACPHATRRVSNEWLLDKERIAKRAASLFDPAKAKIKGSPISSSDTVSFQVVDNEGNAISFVNSNFMGFGTGLVPTGCGFALQNRGYNFSLDPNHVNHLAGGKRPYHTIIPAMLTYTDSGELYATMSNMGGFMQPQGHLQHTISMVAGELDPQLTVDIPRYCIPDGTKDGALSLEVGVPPEVVAELEQRGHDMQTNVKGHSRSVFGRAQIIKKDRETGVLWAGSDGRADGCAMGF